MRIALPIVALVIAGALVGCGGDQSAVSPGVAGSPTPSSIATSTATPTLAPMPAPPAYELLKRAALEKALLKLDHLPPGYSQDPPEEDGNKYFCDYRPPTEEKLRVRRDFTKGGGMSTEFVSMTLRQFESTKDAKAAYKAMARTLKTCKGEVYEGTRLAYSPMSAPQLGDASTGLKIDADGVTLLQNFVLAGPVIISVGGGGLMNADAEVTAGLLKIQVKRYLSAARR